MPNIDDYLQQILSAVYGEEVRGSIHDAIAAMNLSIDKSFYFKGDLPDNTYLNNLKGADTTGMYRLLGQRTYTGLPSDYKGTLTGCLFVYAAGSNCTQELHYFVGSGINATMCWIRHYNNSWGEWYSYDNNYIKLALDNNLSTGFGIKSNTWEVGGLYISESAGEEYTTPNIRTTFMAVDPSTRYRVINQKGKSYRLFQYNSGKSFISVEEASDAEIRYYVTGANTRYLRVMIYSDPSDIKDSDGFVLYDEKKGCILKNTIRGGDSISSGMYESLEDLPIGEIFAATASVINAMSDAPIDDSSSGANILTIGGNNYGLGGNTQFLFYWNGEIYYRSYSNGKFNSWVHVEQYSIDDLKSVDNNNFMTGVGIRSNSWEKGGLFITEDPGSEYDSPNVRTPFIEVEPSTRYRFVNLNAKSYRIFQYGEGKVFISVEEASDVVERAFTTDEETKYLRVMIYSDPSDIKDVDGFVVYDEKKGCILKNTIRGGDSISSGMYEALEDLPIGEIFAANASAMNEMTDAPISDSVSGANVLTIGGNNYSLGGNVQLVFYWSGEFYFRSYSNGKFNSWVHVERYGDSQIVQLRQEVRQEKQDRISAEAALRDECIDIVEDGVAEEVVARQTQYEDIQASVNQISTALTAEVTRAQNVENSKVNKPSTNPNGTSGQVLKTNGDGTTRWDNAEAPTQQQIDAAVSEWMDEHPEASTTIEDGSVSFSKLAQDINKAQVVKNITELKETTADYVYVLENDSKVSDLFSGHGVYDNDEPFTPDRGGCWFWKHKNNLGGTERDEIYGGYKRTNGDTMFAMPDQGNRSTQSNEAVSTLLDTFSSYFNKNNFIYGQAGTLFMENCTPNANNKFMIDCTSLVSAVTQGVRYDLSRYSLGNAASNIVSVNGIRYPSTRGTNLLYLIELVEYFAERKQLFTIQKEGTTSQNIIGKNGLLPGDILFSCSPEATGLEQQRWNTYYAVDHVVIVLATYPEEGTILVGEAGGSGAAKFSFSALYNTPYGWVDNDNTSVSRELRTVKISQVDFYTHAGTKYRVFARPAYNTGRAANNISGFTNSQGYVSTTAINQSKNLAWIYPTVPMVTGKGYTLCIKGTLPRYETDGEYLLLQIEYMTSDGQAKYMPYSTLYRVQGDGRQITTVFVVPNDTDIYEIKSIMVMVRSGATSYGHTYIVDEISLYDGVSYFSNGSRALSITRDTSFPNQITNYSYINGDCTFINIKFNATGENGNEILVGKINNLPPSPSGSEVVISGRIGKLNDASLVIKQDGTIYYATNSASTGLAVFRGVLM